MVFVGLEWMWIDTLNESVSRSALWDWVDYTSLFLSIVQVLERKKSMIYLFLIKLLLAHGKCWVSICVWAWKGRDLRFLLYSGYIRHTPNTLLHGRRPYAFVPLFQRHTLTFFHTYFLLNTCIMSFCGNLWISTYLQIEEKKAFYFEILLISSFNFPWLRLE